MKDVLATSCCWAWNSLNNCGNHEIKTLSLGCCKLGGVEWVYHLTLQRDPVSLNKFL